MPACCGCGEGGVRPSGSEANSYGLRLARAYPGKQLVLRMDGGFHGQNDYLLGGKSSLAGLPSPVASGVITIPYNDIERCVAVLSEHVIDIFSRYVTAWLVAAAEHAIVAKDFLADAMARNGVAPHTIHADRRFPTDPGHLFEPRPANSSDTLGVGGDARGVLDQQHVFRAAVSFGGLGGARKEVRPRHCGLGHVLAEHHDIAKVRQIRVSRGSVGVVAWRAAAWRRGWLRGLG